MIEFLAIIIVLYFLPAVLASTRQHDSSGMIFVLNLLLGWTVIGWIILLVWSMFGAASTTRRKRRRKLMQAMQEENDD